MTESLEDSFKDLAVSTKELLTGFQRYTRGLENRVMRTEDKELAFACRATADMLESIHRDYSWRTETLANRYELLDKSVDRLYKLLPLTGYSIEILGEEIAKLKTEGVKVDKIEKAVADMKPVFDGILKTTEKVKEQKRKEIEERKKIEDTLAKQKEEFQNHIQ